ncbi:MAG: hypothetical protein JO307_27330 [Bryobacterales bacterium]|nr:hypothetical protein [Bryobacterales bacterium]
MRFVSTFLLLAAGISAAGLPEFDRARDLYQHTNYRESIKVLLALSPKDPNVLQLLGQNYYMAGDFKKSSEALEKAVAMGNSRAETYLWLGRAYGRRAETAGPFSAPGLAGHARKNFEKAVELDITSHEAAGDLMDYYLGAPGFMGGGMNKAEDLAKRVAAVDAPEGEYLWAQIEDKRKHYDAAENHLRKAKELSPREIGRLLPLAVHLAKHGRTKESDALFAEAASLAPGNPHVVFDRAETYVETQRNLDDARRLLREYVTLPLTPEDPPRESAQALLAKIQP